MLFELLQQIGLSKYEAEAYVALVRFGALTGYELGKRSEVPLSRSYDVLNRLADKGFVLVQPGEPPRYAALPPEQVLERLRAEHAARLEALAQAFTTLEQPDDKDMFWVARGRTAALGLARDAIEHAGSEIAIRIGAAQRIALEQSLAAAQTRGCRLVAETAGAHTTQDELTLVVDGRVALVGRLTPADSCQVMQGRDTAFVANLRRSFGAARSAVRIEPPARSPEPQRLDWLAWEERKQRHLLGSQSEDGGVSSA